MTTAHPWDEDPSPREIDDTIEAYRRENPPEIAVPDDHLISPVTLDRLLDDLGTDPGALALTVGNVRDDVTLAVRTRSDARRDARVKLLDGADPAHATDVRVEVVGACDDADVLEGLAGAFTAGAREARGIAGDLVHELPGRGGRPRASLKVGDGKGFELSLTRSQRRELSVDVDEVVDVIAAHLIAATVETSAEAATAAYAHGIRDGIAALRDVLSTSPTFRSSALDALVKRLEDREENTLARRLRKAYGRVDVGEASVKVDRKPLRRDSEEPTP